MKLISFKGTDVHDYLQFEIDFNDQLTFLTGINGSGKTTALNAIISLLRPSLQFLCDVNYGVLRVDFIHDGENGSISASTVEKGALLRCSHTKEELLVNSFLPDADIPPYKKDDEEKEYYQNIVSINSTHPVLDYILKLPTPMYLGLDRRNVAGPARNTARSSLSFLAHRVRKRSVFAGSLELRLLEAIGLAEASYSEAAVRQNSIDDTFKKQLFLELIGVTSTNVDIGAPFALPTREEVSGLTLTPAQLSQLATLLGVEQNQVEKRLRPISKFTTDLLRRLEQFQSIENSNEKELFPELVKQVLAWQYNREHVRRIQRLSRMITEYNKQISEVRELNNKYIDSIKSFFNESGKNASFDKRGQIVFTSGDSDRHIDLNSLSSGEIQLFVILTYLFFDPYAKLANVFIVDEPELSLHVQWQEKFVDSVLAAAEKIQFILATHSPSIILNRTNDCIEVTQ